MLDPVCGKRGHPLIGWQTGSVGQTNPCSDDGSKEITLRIGGLPGYGLYAAAFGCTLGNADPVIIDKREDGGYVMTTLRDAARLTTAPALGREYLRAGRQR